MQKSQGRRPAKKIKKGRTFVPMNAKREIFFLVGIILFSALLALIIAYLVVSNHKANTDLDKFIWMGNLTSTSITFKFCIKNSSVPVRLGISTQEDYSNPTFSDVMTQSSEDEILSYTFQSLSPDTSYYYFVDIEAKGNPSSKLSGNFKTPGIQFTPYSFSFALSSCAKTGSNSEIFDVIREKKPLFYLQMGDLFYGDIELNDESVYSGQFNAVLKSKRQSSLYRNIPLAYMWDDHDFGDNNSNKKNLGKAASRKTYQKYVPHYTLPAGSGDVPIYQSFWIGRVKFILTDQRSEKDLPSITDGPDKSVLGTIQKQWFKQELLDSQNASIIFWMSSFPWIFSESPGNDKWGGYTFERKELANFIHSNNLPPLYMLSGDQHSSAFDDGTNNNYHDGGGKGFPVFHASPLDARPSVKGGPYSGGCAVDRGQFGLVKVEDSLSSTCIIFEGYNRKSQFFSWNSCSPETSKKMGECKKPTVEGSEYILVGIGILVVANVVYAAIVIIDFVKSRMNKPKQETVALDDLDSHDKAS